MHASALLIMHTAHSDHHLQLRTLSLVALSHSLMLRVSHCDPGSVAGRKMGGASSFLRELMTMRSTVRAEEILKNPKWPEEWFIRPQDLRCAAGAGGLIALEFAFCVCMRHTHETNSMDGQRVHHRALWWPLTGGRTRARTPPSTRSRGSSSTSTVRCLSQITYIMATTQASCDIERLCFRS